MPIENLKRTWDKAATPEPGKAPIDYFDLPPGAGGCRGLGLRVTASGRSWFVNYYSEVRTLNRAGKLVKKKERLVLGRDFDYAQARERAEEILHEVALVRSGKDGIVDPAEAKRSAAVEERRKASGLNSFAGLAAVFIERYAKTAKRSWGQDQRRINKYLIPAWGNLEAADVTRKHVRALLDQITDAGSPAEANRVLALVRKIFNWAIRRDLVDMVNPGANHDSNPEAPRTRYLSGDEIKVIWRGFENGTYDQGFADLCNLGLLTGQRLKSLCGLQWPELDLAKGWMTIPAGRMKQKKAKEHDHRVPLVGLALDILRKREKDSNRNEKFVFPSRRTGVTTYVTKIGAFKYLREALRKEFPDAARDPEYIDPTFHDFRRTLSTHVNEMHNPMLSIAVEHVLDHVVGTAISRIYNVSDNFLAKRDALIAWNEFICALVGAEHRIESINVTKLKAA